VFLGERSVTLGGLYELTCTLLEDRRPAGWQHMAAHAARELMNRLADHVAEVPVIDPSVGSTPLRPEDISRRLGQAIQDGDQVLRDVAVEIVDAVAEGGRVTELRAAALVAQTEAGQPLDEAATDAWVRAWRALQRRFAGWAHVPGPAVHEVPEDQLERAWQELTDLVAARVAREPFFESMDDLLELARRPEPDLETVRRALARLRPGTKDRFYAELADPAWVQLLADEGMFDHPAAAIREGEFVRFPGWAEGLVLLRFAAGAPESVARAATSVPESGNARVARILAEIAAALPAELVADNGLAARIARDLGSNAQLLDVAEPAGAVAVHLARAGRRRKARDILEALLRIDVITTPSGADFLPDWRHGRFRHDEYLVDQTVRPLVAEMVALDGEGTVKSLTRLLIRAQRALAYADSTRWRDDVLDTRSPGGDDPRHLLFELLRDACTELAARSNGSADWVLEHLEAQESAIFDRLRLHFIAEVPGQAPRRRAALLDPDSLFAAEAIAENYRLLEVGFADLDSNDQAAVVGLIAAGPPPERYAPQATETATLAPEVAAWQDHWRQRLLTAIEPMLDDESRAQLEDLRARRGRLEHPELSGVRSSSWIGPSSPVSATQLDAMAPDEAMALLRDFRAERHFQAPSPEGLARELAGRVQANPSRWAWTAKRIEDLPPIYVRGWLTGLASGVREGHELTGATDVLRAIGWVLEQPADPADQPAVLEGDVDYYQAQRVAADLLIEALARDQIELVDRELAWSLVLRLTTDPDPTAERERATDAAPMQLSFSALRAQGALAVVRYAQWLDARLPSGEGPGPLGFEAAPETKAVLERLLDTDPSRAVRAALAAELPVLASLDREWLAGRIATVADPIGNELAKVGWSTYLNYSSVFVPAIELLAGAYRRAVGALATAPAEIDADRRALADHVAVVWRDATDIVQGLLDEHLAIAPDADRARAIATLGRALNPRIDGGYQPTDADLERHRSLWDDRLNDAPGPLELREFGWWWLSGRLSDPDDLRRLTATARLARGRIGEARPALSLVDKLIPSNAALIDPALELLEVLAQERAAQSQHIDPALLSRLAAAALARPSLRERATAVVHSLGEQGYVTLRSLLD
jgi:hypothetical protein